MRTRTGRVRNDLLDLGRKVRHRLTFLALFFLKCQPSLATTVLRGFARKQNIYIQIYIYIYIYIYMCPQNQRLESCVAASRSSSERREGKYENTSVNLPQDWRDFVNV